MASRRSEIRRAGTLAMVGSVFCLWRGGAVRASDFLAALGAEGITSLLVVGGGRTAGWLVAEGAVDRYAVFVAPLLLGEGIRAVSGWASRSPSSGRRLAITSVRRVGPDLEITAEPVPAKEL